jgi:hypothetical protein
MSYTPPIYMTGLHDYNNFKEPRVILEVTHRELNLIQEALDSKSTFYGNKMDGEKDKFISDCCKSRMNSFKTLLISVNNLIQKIK